MKKYIRSANFGGYQYRYEVHCMMPDGKDILRGGSATLEGAEEIARNQSRDIFNNPFEDPDRKYLMLENLYIWDSVNNEDCTTYDVEDYVDQLMSELDSRKPR